MSLFNLEMNSEDNKIYDFHLKYIIMGEPKVGKSNLLSRFAFNHFFGDNLFGYEFGVKKTKIRNKIYKIIAWDSDRHYFKKASNLYKKSTCALIVYDITNKESFTNIIEWIEVCLELNKKSIYMILVGNKSDLSEQREVSIEEGQKLADKYGMKFFECSGKTGNNVEEIFYKSLDDIAKKIEQGLINLSENGIHKNNSTENSNFQLNKDDSKKLKKNQNC